MINADEITFNHDDVDIKEAVNISKEDFEDLGDAMLDCLEEAEEDGNESITLLMELMLRHPNVNTPEKQMLTCYGLGKGLKFFIRNERQFKRSIGIVSQTAKRLKDIMEGE